MPPLYSYSPRFLSRFCHVETRVRFAPSPTGELHLGGLRTALYNYLFARSRGGRFIVRIEDTDRGRLVDGSADRIRRVLTHYGLIPDEDPWKGGEAGPYVQSERLPLYVEHTDSLIESGHAYRCFCTQQRLELLRKNAARLGSIPMYDRRCRSISSEESKSRMRNGEEYVVRFVLDRQDVSFEDTVFGAITQNLDESDPVLLKSDGFPTYHLANIVDDHLMRISHVIRGMEWLSSTGKHVLLYRAFNWTPPQFVHIPLITRDGKKKLSKRDKDAFVDYYDRHLGVLPKALLTFLVRNGSGMSNFDESMLYSLEEMIIMFDVDRIGRRNFMLDTDSLENYGSAAFKEESEEELIRLVRERLREDLPTVVDTVTDDYLRRVIQFLRDKEEKFAFLSQLTRGRFSFFFTRPLSSEKVLSKFSKEKAIDGLNAVIESGKWEMDHLKECSSKVGMPHTKLFLLLRLSLIDDVNGPPISELREFFGDKECIERLIVMRDYLVKPQQRSVAH